MTTGTTDSTQAWVVVMGDRDIDYVSAFGPFPTREAADAAVAEGERLHPGHADAVAASGENQMRTVRLEGVTRLYARMKETAEG